VPARRLSIALSTFLVLIAIVRICLSYSHTAQAFDEPCHVAAGIEFLDKKTYSLDPVHPPLSRIAIALPLYLAGERFPRLPRNDPQSDNYNVVGNHILYDSGHQPWNLTLARIGVLPFFIFLAVIVYLWTIRIAGEASAILAVFFCTTIPTILAFSSIAYTDIVAAATQLAALFAFSLCLEKPGRARTLWFALALGLALLSKLTTVLFLPAAGFCMFLVWIWKTTRAQRGDLRHHALAWLGAVAVALIILWGGYRFSFKSVQEVTGLSPAAMPTFQHFPAVARPILTRALAENFRLPAPELLSGISHAWLLNNIGAPSYLFGKLKVGGWWYFYLCAIALKLPIPFLILFGIAVVSLLKHNPAFPALLPLAALLGVLLITCHVNYQVGLRHVLICLPLMAIITAAGLKTWMDAVRAEQTHSPAPRNETTPEQLNSGRSRHPSWRSATSLLLLILLIWQLAESVRGQKNFLAYFNQSAGKDPSRALSLGCDFDCGQDLYALRRELQSRHIVRFTLAVWTSADVNRSGLPPYDLPDADGKAQGWIAVSSRAYRLGNFLHQSLPPHSFDWLESYKPVADVGETIKLYYVDPDTQAGH